VEPVEALQRLQERRDTTLYNVVVISVAPISVAPISVAGVICAVV